MVSWGSSVVLVLMILIFGFYFDMLVISIALAAVIFLIATASGGSTPKSSGGGAPVAQQAAVAPTQPAPQPQQPQVVIIKQPVSTDTRLSGWKPKWNRSPIPITIVKAGQFDPLWKKVSRGMGGFLGKGIRKLKEGLD